MTYNDIVFGIDNYGEDLTVECELCPFIQTLEWPTGYRLSAVLAIVDAHQCGPA